MLFALFLCLIQGNELPIFTVNEIQQEANGMNTSTGYYCYVINNTELEDLSFRFFVFKVMVVDMKIITAKNPKFCIIHDENAFSPVLRVYKQKMKNIDYPIPDTETMINTWGDQSFGGYKITETVKKYTYGLLGMKNDLKELYEMEQTEEVKLEIKKFEERLLQHKNQTLKNVASLFQTREMQRNHIREYIETEGTDKQKHRYRAILGYDPLGDDDIDNEYDLNQNEDFYDNNINDNKQNNDISNKMVDSNEFEDDKVERDNDKYFEDMFIKNQEKMFLNELHKANNDF